MRVTWATEGDERMAMETLAHCRGICRYDGYTTGNSIEHFVRNDALYLCGYAKNSEAEVCRADVGGEFVEGHRGKKRDST